MKKITFILFALITGTTFAQNGATHSGTAQVYAEIISPISIQKQTDLNFARIIGNSTGGEVVISPAGARTSSNNSLLDPSTKGEVSAATFYVNAAKDKYYSINISENDLSNGTGTEAESMALVLKSTLDGSSPTGSLTSSLPQGTGTGADQVLAIGGTLTVGANQTQGNYTGEIKVTVAYQ